MTDPVRSYRHLGNRTLAIFIVANTKLFFLFSFLVGVMVWAKQFVPEEYAHLVGPVLLGAVGLDILFLAGAFLVGWVEYLHYSIALDVNGIMVKKGFIFEKERSVPYRRIQEVRVNRTITDKIWGVSTVVIDILGAEDESPLEENRVVIGAVARNMAVEIRNELLKRSQVEQVTMHPRPAQL